MLIHPQKHPGPVLAFGAAGPGVDGENGIVTVIGPGEHALEFHPVQFFQQSGDFRRCFLNGIFVFGFLAKFTKNLNVIDGLIQGFKKLNRLFQTGLAFQDFLGRVLIVPEIRFSGLEFYILQLITFAMDVKENLRAK